MSGLLVSHDPSTASRYQLGAKVGALGLVELLSGERIHPPELGGPVLVKHAPRTSPSFAGMRDRLVDEAHSNATYAHPNLTAITDVIEDERGLFAVYEHPLGSDLAAINGLLRGREQALAFELAAQIALEMLRGVHHLHTARGPNGERLTISVRDINPAHVLVTARGEVKIANRGLTSILGAVRAVPAPEQVAYYAPERIAGEPFGVRTDLFALGVMLFELLLGRPCFSGATKEAVLGEIVSKGVPAGLLRPAGVPAPLAAVVERATAFVPERRYTSAVDMARELEAWLTESGARDLPQALARFIAINGLVRPASFGAPATAALVPAARAGAETFGTRPAPRRITEPARTAPAPAPPAHAQAAHAPAAHAQAAHAQTLRGALPAQPSAAPAELSAPAGAAPSEVHIVLPPAAPEGDDDEARPRTKAERRKQQAQWVRETAIIALIALGLVVGTMIVTAFERDVGMEMADELGEPWITE